MNREAGLLRVLEELLGFDAVTLDHAMRCAAERLADALGADTADAFMHDAESDALVALGAGAAGGRVARAEGSVLVVPIEVAGQRRGVLMAASAAADAFPAEDLAFTRAVAAWVGLVGDRALYRQQAAERADAEDSRASATVSVDLLTRRQREVAALIAEGLTNQQIAHQLVLQPGTVANHVEHILRRLGLRGRVQVAIWAAQRGLRCPASEGGEADE